MESLFPPKESDRMYPFFGYEGQMCDLALQTDNADQIEEAVKRGWIVPESKTMDDLKLVKAAKKKGALKCAKRLVKLGFEDESWPHPPSQKLARG